MFCSHLCARLTPFLFREESGWFDATMHVSDQGEN